MNPDVLERSRRLPALLNSLVCLACFGLACALREILAVSSGAFPYRYIPGLVIAAVTCSLATAVFAPTRDHGLSGWLDEFCFAAGLSILVVYGLAYFLQITPIPLEVVLAGVILSIGSIALVRGWLRPALGRGPSGVLLVGFDSIARALAPSFGDRIVGVLDHDAARVPPELPFLGCLAQLNEAVEAKRPSRIVVSDRNWRSQIPPRLLFNLRQSGIAIEEGPDLYESTFCRVCWERIPPLDLLFSKSNTANPLAMALDSVYTNLIGLALLVIAAPVLIATAAVVGLNSGGESPLERIECPGFLQIPFQMLRFRTRHRDGSPTRIGKALSALRLVNLPRLINLMRGEMVLFGPPPVRKEFADRLTEILPVYPQRFAVKPGILGWSQVCLRKSAGVSDEADRLGYDLYYVKAKRPSLDLEILFKALSQARLPARGKWDGPAVEL
jgi:lipopolysaccharide/colanic/teichoic acid biosynthesis glycosyltransferase